MKTKEDKEKELLELAELRKLKCYSGYKPIHYYFNGFYECDYVSPYSKSANNVNTEVFVILQDWSSDDNMNHICEETNKLGYSPKVKTNSTLISLLGEHLDLDLKDTYTTNLFPFIKMGSMSANIPIRDMRKAARDFTLPMIKIIEPKIAIALGRQTFNSLFDSCEDKKESSKNSFKYLNTKIFHQPHPAARISEAEKGKRWKEMKNYLNELNKI